MAEVDCTELLYIITKEVQKKDAAIDNYATEIANHVHKMETLNNDIQNKEKRIDELEDLVAALEQKNSAILLELKESQRGQTEFTKVSQIVNIERENHALKKEILILNARIEKLMSQKHVDEDNNKDKEYYEKKIKGITYFVSDDIIYENVDGEVGKPLGKITKVDGRAKAVWD